MKYLAFSMMNVQDRQYLHPGQGSYSVWNKEASCRENHLIMEQSGRLGILVPFISKELGGIALELD